MKIFKLYILLLFLCSGIIISAQDSRVDSLKLLLSTQVRDTSRINLLNEIADAVHREEPEEAIRYSTEARKLAEMLSFPKGEARAYNKM